MKKTGHLLKEKREGASLSLSEVALATKINPKILTAIEEGDESRLPAKTFLKGFVRSYALFLKMDVEEVLRVFHEEIGAPAGDQRVHEAYKQEASGSSPSSTRRRVSDENSSGMRTAAVVVIVLLIGLIIGVRELIEKYQREKTLDRAETIKVTPLQQPAEGPQTPPPPPQPAPAAEAQTATPVPAAATPATESASTPAPAPAPAAKAEPSPPPPVPVRPPPPTPAPVVTHTPPPAPTAAEEPAPAPPPEPTPKAAKAQKNEIILEALDKVDVSMQIKGQTKKISLNATQVHTVHSDQPVVFDFSDGGAVNIIVNGRERGVPGDLGKPKQVTVP